MNQYTHPCADPLPDLPDCIQHIVISSIRFNQPLDNLPDGLFSLKFCENSLFNQSLNNLPNTLQTLVLGKYYRQKSNYLPQSLQLIDISNCWQIECLYDDLCIKHDKNVIKIL